MDAGTILSVVQLSASVFKLGRDIAFEFVGPEGAPRRLRHLNTRLQILNSFLEKILEQPGSPDKLSTIQFPGSESIEKTLKECKTFLEQYKSLLSENPSRSATAQRVLLTVGPDAARIDEFHKKIDQHYAELEQWRIGSLTDRIDELHVLVESIRGSISVPPTNHPSPYPTPNSGHPTHEIGPHPMLYSIISLADLMADQQLLSPAFHSSPIIRAQSRASSLNSITELPPAAIQNPPFTIDRAHPPNRPNITESGPSVGLVDRGSPDTGVGAARVSYSSSSGSYSGHHVTLVLGAREIFQFSHDAYEVHEGEMGRIIEWHGSQIQVRHFLPSGIGRIPYTKPNDLKMEVTFLPRGSKHQFEITTPEASERKNEKFRYQFTHKADREIFQRRIRLRQSLQMVQVVRIHKHKEENIAINVHLKVWGRSEKMLDPTFSFACFGKNESNHHEEFVIRWFRREPDRKGEKRLILRPYSEDTDLNYGPGSNERSSAFRELRRRMSMNSSVSLGSRPSAVGNSSAIILYEGKGETAPEHVRRLGCLDIEFESMGLREKFVNACYEAYHGARNFRRSTLESDVDSASPNPPSLFSSISPSVSQTTTSHHSTGELEGVGLGVDMGTPVSPQPLQLPSPAIQRTAQFESLSLFTMPNAAISIPREIEPSEPSPTDTQHQGPPTVK
ncbi:hypothetical protein F5Y09DRAFT_334662 [Xylaria sp. FL1042]|nr:hypothetical protein F5Y09DRAFT_334662 [Xylaria sp. FL1042]